MGRCCRFEKGMTNIMKMEVTINQVSPETSGTNQGWILVNVKLLVGLLGMAACIAWMVIMLITGVARGMTPADELAVMAAHLAFVVGILFLGLDLIGNGGKLVFRKKRRRVVRQKR